VKTKIAIGIGVIVVAVVVWVLGMPLWRERTFEHDRTEGGELAKKRRFEEAEKRLLDAVKGAEALGAADPRLYDARSELAELYAAQGKYPESQALYLRSLETQAEGGAPKKADMARSLFKLGETYRAQENLAAAEGHFNMAIAAWQESATPDHPELASVLVAKAELLRDQGRFKEAEPLLGQALAIREKTNDPQLARTAEVYAVVLRQLGQTDRAQAMEARAAGKQ